MLIKLSDKLRKEYDVLIESGMLSVDIKIKPKHTLVVLFIPIHIFNNYIDEHRADIISRYKNIITCSYPDDIKISLTRFPVKFNACYCENIILNTIKECNYNIDNLEVYSYNIKSKELILEEDIMYYYKKSIIK